MPSVIDNGRARICEACDGDGGGDYCSGHYGGEPVYQHVTCSECDGSGRIDLCDPTELLPGEPLPARVAGSFFCDLGEEIPF